MLFIIFKLNSVISYMGYKLYKIDYIYFQQDRLLPYYTYNSSYKPKKSRIPLELSLEGIFPR